MNLATIIINAVAHHGASIEAPNGNTLRTHNSEQLPREFVELIRKYKPYILQCINQTTIQNLLDTIQQHGAELEIIHGTTIRLHQPEQLPERIKASIKAHKHELIQHLNPSPQQQQQRQQDHTILAQHFEYEAIQVYFDRLQHKLQNLIKINKPINQAVIKPKEFIQSLAHKFYLPEQAAQDYVAALIEHRIFIYSCNFKIHITPNYRHPSMAAFTHYQRD